MRPVTLTALAAGCLLLGSYWYAQTSHICPIPISYQLGEIDERFGISANDARAVVQDAEAIWEDKAGRNLFAYDDQAKFKINFIYDERQQLATTEEEWRLRLDVQESAQGVLADKIKNLGGEFDEATASFAQIRTQYEDRLAAYNAKVEGYNQTGGAPKEEYAKLQQEAKEITAQLKALESDEQQLNKKAQVINELGATANENISSYNEEVKKYNEIFGSRETYTQGDFERKRINVYKFSTKEELVLVIAHEFGHALGIGHVEEEGSIMYYLATERDSTSLSGADIAAFQAVCGDTTTFAQEMRYVIRTALAYLPQS